jgi:hypothetical protein
MTGSFQAAPVLSPGAHQTPPTGLRTGAAEVAIQADPFHLDLPSGESVVSHLWPFQYHCPSGETCPIWSTIPFLSKSGPSGPVRAYYALSKSVRVDLTL